MFHWYDDTKWRDCAAPATIVDEINRLAAIQDGTPPDTQFFRWRPTDAVEAADGARAQTPRAVDSLAIPVTKIECFHRRLSFYRHPCWLFKLTCAHDPAVFRAHAAMAQAYEPPIAFVVLRAGNGEISDQEIDQQEPTAFDDILRVSWNAFPIHTFNGTAHGHLNLSGPDAGEDALDTDIARDYLRFFTGFTRSVEGPFLCVERFDELQPSDAPRDDLTPLATLLRRHGYRGGIDDFSAQPEGAGNDGFAQGAPERFDDQPMQRAPLSSDDDGQSARVRFTARMLYGDTCFDATFLVEADGRVRVGDEKVVFQNSQWAVHEIRAARNGTYLLLRRRPKQFMWADTLKASLREEIEAGTSVHVVNQRVRRPFDLGGLDSRVAIEFRNVEFLDDVSFEEARLEHGLSFVHCQFARTLSLRGARLKGALELRGCTIYGFRDVPTDYALDLSGLRTESSVLLSDCQITGPLSGRGLRIDEDLILRGVRHLRRRAVQGGGAKLAGDRPQAIALDLESARIDGKLCIEAYETDKMGSQTRQNTQLSGDLVIRHARLQEGYLQCRLTGYLNAEHLECEGHLRFEGHLQRKGHRPVAGARPAANAGEQPRDLGADLYLVSARLKTLEISGVTVAGNLNLAGAMATGMVLLTGNQIGGDAIMSGGQFDADVDLRATRIGGSVKYYTGRVGRLFLGAKGAAPGAAQSIPAAAQDIAVLGGISLIGVKAGRLSFHNVLVCRRSVDASVATAPAEDIAIAGNVQLDFVTVDTNIAFYVDTDQFLHWPGHGCTIEGALRIRGSTTGGHLILSNLTVGNEIDITACRIEGGIYLKNTALPRKSGKPQDPGEPSRLATHCQLFVATNTSVSLDADLSGLDCRKANCQKALDARLGEALAARLRAQKIATDGRESVDWLPSDTPRGQFQQGVAARGLTVKGRLQFGVMPSPSAGGEPAVSPAPSI